MTQTELKQMIREELEKSSGSKKSRTTENKRKRLKESWTHDGLESAFKELEVQFDDAQAQYYDDEGEPIEKKDVEKVDELMDELWKIFDKYFN